MPPIKYVDSLSTFRAIRNELRKLHKGNTADQDLSVKHMLDIFRANQITEKRYCRPEGHYKYFADTYLTYLKSSRLQDELTSKYFKKGDRSIESSARLVGLELPKQVERSWKLRNDKFRIECFLRSATEETLERIHLQLHVSMIYH